MLVKVVGNLSFVHGRWPSESESARFGILQAYDMTC